MESSPTGVPMLSPKFVPYLIALVGLAGLVMSSVPQHTLAFKIAAGVQTLGAALGLASPGLRKAS